MCSSVCAWVCTGVRAYAGSVWDCAGVRKCLGVQGYARVYAGVCESARVCSGVHVPGKFYYSMCLINHVEQQQ